MAKAEIENTPSDWTVDDAFCYLTKTIGLRDYDAIHQMTERIRSGRLSVRVNGNSPPPKLWIMGQLVLTIDNDGRAEVTPTVGMKPWPCVFTVAERDVRMLWEPPADKPAVEPTTVEPFRTGGPGRPSAMDRIVAEFKRRVAAGEVIPWRGGCTAEAEHLAGWWETHRPSKAPRAQAGAIKNKILPIWSSLIPKT
jgi:hypothetical protein